MQTNIHPDLIDRADVTEANDILRRCVHCGFCTAVCPTYQLLGDELDGPRGRIYLIKNMLEDNNISAHEVRHIDRCLTCRACETACPSGVEYGRLLDIGRGIIQEKAAHKKRIRPFVSRMTAWALRHIVPYRNRFAALLRLGQALAPFLPKSIARKVPRSTGPVMAQDDTDGHGQKYSKRVLLLDGCVQGVATPGVNQALMRLLASRDIGVERLTREGCCGALDYHLSAQETGLARMRALIDQIYPRLEQVDAIISTASGCGVTIKEYPTLLQKDTGWQKKAQAVADKVYDVSELLEGQTFNCRPTRVALHVPCSLQHGQKIVGVVESILTDAGIHLTEVKESHLCCGSAGPYSLMQPGIAESLLSRKVTSLEANDPEIIVTANVGCQMHLQSGTRLPVMHWVELLERQLKTRHNSDSLPASR